MIARYVRAMKYPQGNGLTSKRRAFREWARTRATDMFTDRGEQGRVRQAIARQCALSAAVAPIQPAWGRTGLVLTRAGISAEAEPGPVHCRRCGPARPGPGD